MWLGCSRLLFINILLGIGEGVLIARVFRIDRKKTPYLWWQTCYATVLPGDRVIYQLADQVVLLDLNLRKICLIALGRGPVVTLD